MAMGANAAMLTHFFFFFFPLSLFPVLSCNAFISPKKNISRSLCGYDQCQEKCETERSKARDSSLKQSKREITANPVFFLVRTGKKREKKLKKLKGRVLLQLLGSLDFA